MKTWVMGDVHGAWRAMHQCLQRANFDYDEDILIQIGDLVDGWSETYEVVEELLKIRNLYLVKGNHDDWFDEWLATGVHPANWEQGSRATLKSYGERCMGDEFKINDVDVDVYTKLVQHNMNPGLVPDSHVRLFRHQRSHIRWEDKLFIHGGFNRHYRLDEQHSFTFMWDRDLWLQAMSSKEINHPLKIKEKFGTIYIGHTATTNWLEKSSRDRDIVTSVGSPISRPMHAANIWNIDTGAGFNGRLSIMNVETEECVQSDFVQELYPNERGRN